MIDFVERALLVAVCKKVLDKNEVDSVLEQVADGLLQMEENINGEEVEILTNMYRKLLN